MGEKNAGALPSSMKIAEARAEAKAEALKKLYVKTTPACSLLTHWRLLMDFSIIL